jgi:hypothetical protein
VVPPAKALTPPMTGTERESICKLVEHAPIWRPKHLEELKSQVTQTPSKGAEGVTMNGVHEPGLEPWNSPRVQR